MYHKQSVEDIRALVPSRFVKKLTTARPKKIKAILTKQTTSVPPKVCKDIERYVLNHKRLSEFKTRNKSLVSDPSFVFCSSEPFPFDRFYSETGVFEYHKAFNCLQTMFGLVSSPTNLVIHMFVESLWKREKHWQVVLKDKLKEMRVFQFRSPQSISTAIDNNRFDVADELLKYSDPGALKELAHNLVLMKNTDYLIKIFSRLNVSSRNEVLFQGLSRLYRENGYEHIWSYLTQWCNPYKVASKMLYMRETSSADFLLSQSYVPLNVVSEAWRYVEKAGLENEMPATASRLQQQKLWDELSDMVAEKGEEERKRKKI